MAQLTDDCFAFGGPMLTVAEAVAIMRGRLDPVCAIENVAVSAADGRVLAADVVAELDLPPFDNSAVDGYAIAHADLDGSAETRLPIAQRIIAGDASMRLHGVQTASRIFTGARMPQGADTVFMQEDVREDNGAVILPAGLRRGANARHAGEDARRGEIILKKGRTMSPQDIALAAAAGIATLPVRKPLRAAIFSTGNEIASQAEALAGGSIFDANRPMLIALLRRAGVVVTDFGILRDDADALHAGLINAAASHDLVLTTGGVSTGEEDHVKSAVENAGSLVFWRIGIKPGRPVALGILRGGDNDAVFCGLPGNPVAAFVTFVFIVRPLIAQLTGAEPPQLFPVMVRSGFTYKKKKDRREFVRVSLHRDGEHWIAKKHPQDGAGVITSLTATDGLVALAEETTRIAEGDVLAFYPYANLLA